MLAGVKLMRSTRFLQQLLQNSGCSARAIPDTLEHEMNNSFKIVLFAPHSSRVAYSIIQSYFVASLANLLTAVVSDASSPERGSGRDCYGVVFERDQAVDQDFLGSNLASTQQVDSGAAAIQGALVIHRRSVSDPLHGYKNPWIFKSAEGPQTIFRSHPEVFRMPSRAFREELLVFRQTGHAS